MLIVGKSIRLIGETGKQLAKNIILDYILIVTIKAKESGKKSSKSKYAPIQNPKKSPKARNTSK